MFAIIYCGKVCSLYILINLNILDAPTLISNIHTLIPGYVYPDIHTLVPRIFTPFYSYPRTPYIHALHTALPYTPDIPILLPRIFLPSYPLPLTFVTRIFTPSYLVPGYETIGMKKTIDAFQLEWYELVQKVCLRGYLGYEGIAIWCRDPGYGYGFWCCHR